MLRLVPLLARRAAELPRYRVRAQLRHTPGYGADLELEPLAWREGRAGDIPYDIEPDEVPLEQRAPEAGLAIGASDRAARERMRALLDRIDASGIPLAESEERAIESLRDSARGLDVNRLDSEAAGLIELREQLRQYEDPRAHDLADEIQRESGELGDVGLMQIAQWYGLLPLGRVLQPWTKFELEALSRDPIGYRPGGFRFTRRENPYRPGEEMPDWGIDPQMGIVGPGATPEEFAPGHIPSELLPPIA